MWFRLGVGGRVSHIPTPRLTLINLHLPIQNTTNHHAPPTLSKPNIHPQATPAERASLEEAQRLLASGALPSLTTTGGGRGKKRESASVASAAVAALSAASSSCTVDGGVAGLSLSPAATPAIVPITPEGVGVIQALAAKGDCGAAALARRLQSALMQGLGAFATTTAEEARMVVEAEAAAAQAKALKGARRRRKDQAVAARRLRASGGVAALL